MLKKISAKKATLTRSSSKKKAKSAQSPQRKILKSKKEKSKRETGLPRLTLVDSTLFGAMQGTRKTRKKSPESRWKVYYATGVSILGIGFVLLGYGIFKSDPIPIRIIDPEFKKTENLNLGERIQYWSQFLEPVGEGRKRVESFAMGYQVDDTAPIIPKHYNCTTFIETVAALARSESSDQFVQHLISIRYQDGEPGFARRNHFPEADWIPNNQRAQILTDVTHSIALKRGVVEKIERKTIHRSQWLAAHDPSRSQSRQGQRGLASYLEKAASQPIEAQVPYIELASLGKVINDIPNGTVLNFVHRNDSKHPVLISHQGFMIRENGQTYLRHASRDGSIRTIELNAYIRNVTKKQKRWPLIGVNLNQINDSMSTSSFLRESM